MMRLGLVAFLVCTFCLKIDAQEYKNLYSGGMLFFQPGYTVASNEYQKINSYSSGIGGILRFYPKKHLTLGLHGGSNKAVYKSSNSKNSYISLGYGGVFAGYTTKFNNFRVCTSIGIGGGKIRNLHIEKQEGNVLHQANLYFSPAFSINPLISLDYYLTNKIAFTSQFNGILAFYNKNDLYFCPSLQIGILFNR